MQAEVKARAVPSAVCLLPSPFRIDLAILLVGQLDVAPSPVIPLEAGARVEYAPDCATAIQRLQSGACVVPELIVLAESRAGETSEASIDALRKCAPLARVWRLLGSWCEGEARSARPPAGCLTCYWHQWQPRIARELALAAHGRRPGWALPLTATSDERLDGGLGPHDWVSEAEGPESAVDAQDSCDPSASSNPQPRPASSHDGRRLKVAVRAASAQAAAALVDACREAGFDALVVGGQETWRAPRPVALVWDTTAAEMTDGACVAQARAALDDPPVVALVGFPRADDVARARHSGVAAVVSKPFLVADLVEEIRRQKAEG